MKLNLKTRFSGALYPALFLLILLLSLGLRLYHLGAISLWYDEVGVAMAAMEATLAGAIRIAREHAAAMPLDYVVAWVVVRLLGNAEWALRLAPALWGTFSLVPIYEPIRKLN
jgi:predicted membrane-bound mannosyltransferase